MQVKTAILTAQQTIEMGMTELPAPKADEVTIQPEYVGVCGSDVHFFEFGCIGACKVEYPFVLGHECAGVVTAVGSNVETLHVGDRVTIEPGIPCGRCKFCREGHYNLCRRVKFLSTPPYDGVLREHFNHPADLTYRLPENVSTKDGALMEPLAVGAYACKRGGVHPGSRVAILGGGCIGLMTLLACKAAGAAQIVTSLLWISLLVGRFSCSVIAARFRPWQMITVMCFGIAAFLVLLVLGTSLPVLIVATIGLGLCMSGMYGTTVSNAGDLFSRYPASMGIYVTLNGLGAAAAPAAIGVAANHGGIRIGFALLLIAAAMLVVSALCNMRYLKKR